MHDRPTTMADLPFPFRPFWPFLFARQHARNFPAAARYHVCLEIRAENATGIYSTRDPRSIKRVVVLVLVLVVVETTLNELISVLVLRESCSQLRSSA